MRGRSSSATASSTGLQETHIFLLINMVYVLDLAAGSDQIRVRSCGSTWLAHEFDLKPTLTWSMIALPAPLPAGERPACQSMRS